MKRLRLADPKRLWDLGDDLHTNFHNKTESKKEKTNISVIKEFQNICHFLLKSNNFNKDSFLGNRDDIISQGKTEKLSVTNSFK